MAQEWAHSGCKPAHDDSVVPERLYDPYLNLVIVCHALQAIHDALPATSEIQGYSRSSARPFAARPIWGQLVEAGQETECAVYRAFTFPFLSLNQTFFWSCIISTVVSLTGGYLTLRLDNGRNTLTNLRGFPHGNSKN